MMPLCLTEFRNTNLLQILQADVGDEVNIFVPVLHQNLVVLTQTKVSQPVCQIGLKQRKHTEKIEVKGLFSYLKMHNRLLCCVP